MKRKPISKHDSKVATITALALFAVPVLIIALALILNSETETPPSDSTNQSQTNQTENEYNETKPVGIRPYTDPDYAFYIQDGEIVRNECTTVSCGDTTVINVNGEEIAVANTDIVRCQPAPEIKDYEEQYKYSITLNGEEISSGTAYSGYKDTLCENNPATVLRTWDCTYYVANENLTITDLDGNPVDYDDLDASYISKNDE